MVRKAINLSPSNGMIHLNDVTNDSIIGVETPKDKYRVGRVVFEYGERYGLVRGLDIQKVLGRRSKSELLEHLSVLPIWDFERDVNIYFFDSERELVKWLFDIKEAPVEEESIAHFESGETECIQTVSDIWGCSIFDTGMAFYRMHEAEITPGTVAYVMKKALTEKQYNLFLRQTKNEMGTGILSFMERKNVSPREILCDAFPWSLSKKGYDYWDRIYKKLKTK